RARLRRILLALWRDIPAEHNGFSVNLMQALSTATPDQGYSRDLLLRAVTRIGRLIRASLPPERAALAEVAAFGLTDAFRHHHGDDKLYSWWDYRGVAFFKDQGLRIDVIFASAPLAARPQGRADRAALI
ncbi:MAG TPA: hypothetical protein VF469_41530, partial [Kofleriaceae bacterium]